MQCPKVQAERSDMFNEIRAVEGGCGVLILNNTCNILSILLGKPIEIFAQEQMGVNWLSARKHICKI